MKTQPESFEHVAATLDTIPNLTAWLLAWPKARAEFAELITEYHKCNPERDSYRLELVVDTIDRALYELHHRLAWLEGQLRAVESASPPPSPAASSSSTRCAPPPARTSASR